MKSSFDSWTETTLGGIRILRGVPEDVLLDLGRLAEWRTYPVGAHLLTGDRARGWLFFVTSGLIEVRTAAGDRHEYGAGACMALRHALAKVAPTYSVLATAPVTVGWLHKDDLTDVMTRSPELAQAVAKALAERRNHPFPPIDDRGDLDDRIAEGLVVAGANFVRPDGVATLPTLPDQTVWAALLGVATGDVQRSFARLARAGLVRVVAGERMYVAVARLRARLDRRQGGASGPS